MTLKVGRSKNEVPLNQYLGNLAFVNDNAPRIKAVSSAYTISAIDNNTILVVSGTTTVTLPLVSSVEQSFRVGIKAVTGATVTVARSGSDTIETVGGNKSMTANTGLWYYPVTGGWETI